MKGKHLNILLVITIMLAIIINFSYINEGKGSSLVSLVVTTMYMVVWFKFIWSSRENTKNLILSVICGMTTFACAVATLTVHINDKLIVDIISPFVNTFNSNFTGVESLVSAPDHLIKSIFISLISVIWVIITTIVYIFFRFIFVLPSLERKKKLIMTVVWSLTTFAYAITTLATNITDKLIIDFVTPFATLVVSPLYGIESLFSKSDYLIVSTIILLISMTWIASSILLIKSQEDPASN